ncbi:MAG: complex I subunit 1 family protein [bacterium]
MTSLIPDLLNPSFPILAIILLAPLFGALIAGLDRRITARMQGRIGPPILQPFYDVIKLLRKDPIVVNRIQVVYAFLHLAFMVLALLLLVLGQDSLMFLFIFAFSTLSLVLGGMCVRSPYSRIGSQREIILMVAYEPILILLMIGMYLANGNFLLASPLSANHPMLQTLPLLFIALLVVIAIKLQKSPFDIATSHHAHQEIIKGLTIEYSGPYLAIIEIAHLYEIALLFYLVMLFWASNLILGGLLALAVFFLMTVVDNAFARLTTIWTFRFMWTGALVLALTNVLWLYL